VLRPPFARRHGRSRSRLFVIPLLLTLSLAACQTATAPAPTAIATRAATISPTVESTPTVEATATATATSTPRPSPTPPATATPTPEPPAAPTNTPAPGPTFTLPPAPDTTGQDHFWLSRPVPYDYAIWTEKTYSYGSTRGGHLRPHHGVEFAVPTGTPILAVADGIIRVAGWDNEIAYGAFTNFYGRLIVIELDHQLNGQPLFALYGHLSEFTVVADQRVQQGDQIGLSGSSGIADGPHLHLEIRQGANDYSSTRSPLLWLYPFTGRGVIAGRIVWPDGTLAREVPVSARRIDAPSNYAWATTYADGLARPDDYWNENFAIDDIYAGYYRIYAGTSDRSVSTELWVHPYQTAFVTLTLPEEWRTAPQPSSP